MLDQLLEELMAAKPRDGFTGLDWANTKAAAICQRASVA